MAEEKESGYRRFGCRGSRLDEKRLREERPEIYEQYKKTIQSRRFTVKAA